MNFRTARAVIQRNSVLKKQKTRINKQVDGFIYFILFYFILFYFILFYLRARNYNVRWRHKHYKLSSTHLLVCLQSWKWTQGHVHIRQALYWATVPAPQHHRHALLLCLHYSVFKNRSCQHLKLRYHGKIWTWRTMVFRFPSLQELSFLTPTAASSS